jgi:L-threonylcarbamoyladenylate synthase
VSAAEIDAAAAALRSGGLAVIPTDTVYGLACDPESPEAVARLSELKRRSLDQPIALVAATVSVLLERLPELVAQVAVLDVLLPGPYTLVLANPERRYPWLTGGHADTIGVRVPDVAGVARELLERVDVVAATSANLHGGRDPARVADLAPEMVEAATVLDGGELPGMPSTVLDLTGTAPRVLREGAVPADDALARVSAALAE